MDGLSTQLSFAIIIFVDESKLLITNEDYNRLINAMANPDIKSIKIGQSAYTIGGVSKVLTLEEFYREYPDQKPAEYNSVARRDYSNVPDNRSEALSKNGLVSMIQGLNRAIKVIRSEGKEPEAALKERERLVQKFNLQHGQLPDELKISVVS